MFRFAPRGQVYWPLTLKARDPEGGALIEGKAYVLYSPLSRAELRARQQRLTERMTAGLDPVKNRDDLQTLAGRAFELEREQDADLILHIHGWKDFTQEDGSQLPFSTDVLKAMLNDPLLHDVFMTGLMDCSRGALAKN